MREAMSKAEIYERLGEVEEEMDQLAREKTDLLYRLREGEYDE